MLGRLFQARQDQLESSSINTTGKGTPTLARRLSTMALSLGLSQPNSNGSNNGSGSGSGTSSPTSSLSPPKEKRPGILHSALHQGLAVSSSSNLSNYTNEDSYSRTILYGTPSHLRFTRLEQFHYRMLVVQDKGELLQKNNYKICFDSAKDHHFDKAGGAQKLQNRHPTDELIDFMFGNPIHQDIAIGDRSKIHQLSHLKDLPHSMLITKYFKVNKKEFAIGVVIPISLSNFSEAILSNWCQVSAHLNLVKSTFIENHVERKNPAVAQNYLDVAILFKRLIISINNLVSIPRLLLGLTQASDGMFNHWCYEVQNWIEIKDGTRSGLCGTRFLPTLLTIVNSLKHQLLDMDYSDEFVRVVIMAQNPIVAQKLIFILSGLLPYNLHLKLEEDSDHGTQHTTTKSIGDDAGFSGKGYEEITMNDKLTPPTPSVFNKGWEIPTTPSRSIATPSLMTPTRSSVIQPLSSSQSMAYLSSSLQSHSSFSTSLSRGFSFIQNWKGSLDSTSSTQSYNSPSPGNEYDEYPWTTTTDYTTSANNNNNNITPIASTSTSSTITNPNTSSSSSGTQPIPFNSNTSNVNNNPLPRSFSSYEVPGYTNNSSLKLPLKKNYSNVPKIPHIERNTTTVYGVCESNNTTTTSGGGGMDDELELLRRECHAVMLGRDGVGVKTEYDEIKKVSVLNVSLDDDEGEDGDEDFKMIQTPPPLCGYVNEFVPEFQLQACPMSPDLESKVASSMKGDLNHYQNSRTIFVSLRAREIREFVMMKGCNEVKTHVRKLYGNMKPSSHVDRVSLGKVEATMEALLKGEDISSMVKEW